MNESKSATRGGDTVPACPGCHFSCRIDRYQCGRGEAFHERWKAGEKLPERRMPARGGSDGNVNKPPAAARIEHMLAVVPRVMRQRAGESGRERLLAALGRREGRAALGIVASELDTNVAGLRPAADALVAEGAAQMATTDAGVQMLALTGQGEVARAELDKRHRASRDAFLGAISPEDQERLADLLEKLLHAQPRPERPDRAVAKRDGAPSGAASDGAGHQNLTNP